ncbi:MAG: dihydroorotase, partial [Bdellovibrionales bacterium]|nr:dihydroorotase [Bdellovibrionales bacterium]
IDCKGLHILPGAIDTQVHFREPGLTQKETIESGTRAALFGGITGVFEMPNTKPPTTDIQALREKLEIAKNTAVVDYAFYAGATQENLKQLQQMEALPGCSGIKIFMGSSTGSLLLYSEEHLKEILSNTVSTIAIHAEDEDRLTERKKIVLEQPGHVELHPVWRDAESAIIATKKILTLARQHNRKVHILHVTTAEEVEILSQHRDIASFEITPQHLTLFAPDCYERLGTLAQMNPPIREKRHQEALWKAVTSGLVDVIGSDHAPHTLEEKKQTYPDTPSGMTGVQTILPLMIHHSLNGKLSLLRTVELLSQNPAKLFGIKSKGKITVGFDADLTLIDLKAKKEVKNSWIQSACGWTPYDGMTLNGAIIATLVGGEVVMRDDQVLSRPRGRPLEFIS